MPHSSGSVLQEFRVYLVDGDQSFVIEVVKSISRIGSSVESAADTCISTLMQMIERKDFGSTVLAEVVVAIRQLLKQHPKLHADIIPKLIRFLEKTEVPQARASVVWIVGEYRSSMSKYAPDVLRKLAKLFPNESEVVKFQVLNLAVKLKLDADQAKTDDTNHSESVWTSITLLTEYVLNMARYDMSIDLRDRARLFSFVLSSSITEEQVIDVKSILKEGILKLRPNPVVEKEFEMRRKSSLVLGSISQVLGNVIGSSYSPLPHFPDVPPPSSVRDPIITAAPSVGLGSRKVSDIKAGDNFYAAGSPQLDAGDEWSSDEEENNRRVSEELASPDQENAADQEEEEEEEEQEQEGDKPAEDEDDFGFGS
eukprot:TRINITY_DN2411_c0_g1_i2.p1 TRINITY_DN2411_c0_g1~~TRINITY_DN2411_c0_g1_i2.p1  ORF type:complete len:368 (-),score=103.99 TRINITY_DN2411_c0_g1_i2:1264-2367(-)